MNKYRSGYEERVSKTLPEGFTYECTVLDYYKRTSRKMQCQDCSSVHVLQYAKYLTDFKLPNGIFLEVKGWFKPADRTKMVSVIKCNPTLDIRMVFQKQGWCTKKKLQTYTDWCDKNKIKWAIGKVPNSWLEEPAKERMK
ncbi:MAG: hypothetical protein JKY52_09585 [Flavobacteriales bacterium]|nr:hypothetical protein [Flavobacteriales bacterium]